jgi:hypothetical protein
VKQREILESVRAKAVRRDPNESVGGVQAQLAPTEFLPATLKAAAAADMTSRWAEKIQRERDAERAAQNELEASPDAEGATQPDDSAGDEGKAKRGARVPRTSRRMSKPASS